MISRRKPELVAPAGNLEKLKAALDFGADAVYIGGQKFSLRAMAGNFSFSEMELAVCLAHKTGRRVYVTVNIFAHNRDIEELGGYITDLEKLGVDGLIASDPGVVLLARETCPNIPITISTQASVSNYLSAVHYKNIGAKRIVAARELSLPELAQIKERVDIELEVFIHGAMCLSYSGRCWLSQAMVGRDANRGECAHPCRYRYHLVEEKRPGQYFPVTEDERGTYVMNSKDLCLIEKIPELIEIGVDAFKIEGRMKSPHYVAAVVKVYREAIDHAWEGLEPKVDKWSRELERVASRPFTEGFVSGPANNSQDIYKPGFGNRVVFCGIVRGYDPAAKLMLVEQRAHFRPGDELEFMEPGCELVIRPAGRILNSEMIEVDAARHPQEMLWLESDYAFRAGTLIGKLNDER
ncbi:MAG: peptidase U32 family protein [Candidatus Saccharibacteria bacterium]